MNNHASNRGVWVLLWEVSPEVSPAQLGYSPAVLTVFGCLRILRAVRLCALLCTHPVHAHASPAGKGKIIDTVREVVALHRVSAAAPCSSHLPEPPPHPSPTRFRSLRLLTSQTPFSHPFQERHVFPANIGVSKVSGSGADALFMGVLRPAPDDPTTVKVRLSHRHTCKLIQQHNAQWQQSPSL